MKTDKETPEQYQDRQMQGLRTEITTLQAEKEGLRIALNKSKESFCDEIVFLNDRIASKDSEANKLRFTAGVSIACVFIIVLFSIIIMRRNKSTINTLKEEIANKTWEYHPDLAHAKNIEAFFNEEVFMIPGDTARFNFVKKGMRVLIIKK
jgi:hypothetical protein